MTTSHPGRLGDQPPDIVASGGWPGRSGGTGVGGNGEERGGSGRGDGEVMRGPVRSRGRG